MKRVGVWFSWFVAAIFCVAVGSCVFDQNKRSRQDQAAAEAAAAREAAKPPAQKASEAAAAASAKVAADAAKARAEAEFQFGVMATKLVRASMKNPASFEFVRAGIVNKGALCLTYRATNSFNAVITEQIAITRKLAKGDWNKECGRKTMPSFDHIKHAI